VRSFDKEQLSVSYLLIRRINPALNIPPLHQALQIAMYDEYRARAFYQKVIDMFGAVVPFINIVEAEKQHIAALLPLFYRYGVYIPIDDWYPNLEPIPSLKENCELGVAGEINNVQMYDHLLCFVSQPDVRQVFYGLQAASLNHHLPAFRRCVTGR
jgi:hypothetical protein